MAEPIIQVKDLSKCYRLGQIGTTTFKDELQRLASRVFSRRNRPPSAPEASEFWALKGVSFDVQPGEIVGIIGRNGAGKSTLLKILSHITEPTAGEAVMRGRVASLLEVGTGFHADLTGRENVFLNGAMLGMSIAEIRSKFDEIVAFAEIDQFIDTPVKRYSSGMYVRLAFAVAAHLEPEILILDEVLAVGDPQFQKKCLGKMHEISAESGRTILFVSHNMNAVESLCSSCILMQKGKVVRQGSDVAAIVRENLSQSESNLSATEWVNPGGEWDNEWFIPQRLSLRDQHGKLLELPIRNGQEIWIHIEGQVKKSDPAIQVGYGISHGNGALLFWSTNRDGPESEWQELTPGNVSLRSKIPARFLNEGRYRIDLFAGLYHRLWFCEPGVEGPGVSLEIAGGLSESPYWVEARPGFLGPIFPWHLS